MSDDAAQEMEVASPTAVEDKACDGELHRAAEFGDVAKIIMWPVALLMPNTFLGGVDERYPPRTKWSDVIDRTSHGRSKRAPRGGSAVG
jgi:hypothetical protein